MPVPDIVFFVGDFGFNIEVTLLDENGDEVDLTDFDTVTLRVAGDGVDNPSGSPFTMTIFDATGGIVRYAVGAADFAAGRYVAQVRAVDTGNEQITTDRFSLQVKAAL